MDVSIVADVITIYKLLSEINFTYMYVVCSKGNIRQHNPQRFACGSRRLALGVANLAAARINVL